MLIASTFWFPKSVPNLPWKALRILQKTTKPHHCIHYSHLRCHHHHPCQLSKQGNLAGKLWSVLAALNTWCGVASLDMQIRLETMTQVCIIVKQPVCIHDLTRASFLLWKLTSASLWLSPINRSQYVVLRVANQCLWCKGSGLHFNSFDCRISAAILKILGLCPPLVKISSYKQVPTT